MNNLRNINKSAISLPHLGEVWRGYHPDHLGSSSWITDVNGVAIQHLQYLPFGELRVNQRSTTWNSRYTFSGKEKDTESGYGYFGARYYSSDLSIWISVDPKNHLYPNSSPYVYCNNNPIRLVDPNGMEWLTAADKRKANELKAIAETRMRLNEKLIYRQEKKIDKLKNKGGEKNLKTADRKEGFVDDLKKQNDLLSEGISDLNKMGASNDFFTFTKIPDGNESGVNMSWQGTPYRAIFSIEYDSNPLAWHETVHIGDYMKNSSLWGFDPNGYLGTRSFLPLNNAYAEIHAYRSQFSLCGDGDYFKEVNKLSDINMGWLKKQKFFK